MFFFKSINTSAIYSFLYWKHSLGRKLEHGPNFKLRRCVIALWRGGKGPGLDIVHSFLRCHNRYLTKQNGSFSMFDATKFLNIKIVLLSSTFHVKHGIIYVIPYILRFSNYGYRLKKTLKTSHFNLILTADTGTKRNKNAT
jgi:hypothetical protein